MPPKPKPKLQVGSPRASRTVLDDSTFEELSARADQVRPFEEGLDSREPGAVEKGAAKRKQTPAKPDAGLGQRGKTKQQSSGPRAPNRKGRNGKPYVRKSDGVATVPQYLTLPADLVKRLKIYAVEHDVKVSDVAADALAAYLDKH